MSDRTPSSGQISFDNIRDTVSNFDNHATGRAAANATNNPDGITIGSGTGVAMNEYVMYRDQRGLQRQNFATNSINFLDFDFDFSNVDWGALEFAYYPNNTGAAPNTAEKANVKPHGPFGYHQSGSFSQRSGQSGYLDPNVNYNVNNLGNVVNNTYYAAVWTTYGQNFSQGQKATDFYNMGNKKSFNITVGHDANIKGDSQMSNNNNRNNHVPSFPNESSNIPSFVGRRNSYNTLTGSNGYNSWKANKQSGAYLHFGNTGNGNMGNITTPDGANWPIAAVGFVPTHDHTGLYSTKNNFQPLFCLFVKGNFVGDNGVRQSGWGTNSSSYDYWRNNYTNNTAAMINASRWWKPGGYTTGGKTYRGLFKGIKINLGSGARKYQRPNSNDPTFDIRGQLSHQSKTYRTSSAGADHVFLIGDNFQTNNNSQTGGLWGEYNVAGGNFTPNFKATDHGMGTNIGASWESHGSSWAGPNRVAQNRYYNHQATLGHPDYSRYLWEVPKAMYDPQWFTDTYGSAADTTNNEQQWAYIKHVFQSGKTINVEILEH